MVAESGDWTDAGVAGGVGWRFGLAWVFIVIIVGAGFCGAGETDFGAGILAASSVSHQSQIAIAATMRTMTTMSGQFSLPSENADDACAVCGALFAAAGAGFEFTIDG